MEHLFANFFEGADAFVGGIRPLLALLWSLAQLQTDAIELVAAVATSAAFGFLVIEAIEHSVDGRRRSVLAPASTTAFWAGVTTVPLASLIAPGGAMLFVSGLFFATALARAQLVRARLSP